jgi:hypothetical protein
MSSFEMQTYPLYKCIELDINFRPTLAILEQYMHVHMPCEFYYREDTESRLMFINSIKQASEGSKVVYIKAYKYEGDKKIWRTFILNHIRLVSQYITCHGCLENQPNQLGHMDLGGCMSEY